MKKRERKKFYWRKLDDQAKIISVASSNKYSSTFRLSVILKEEIELNILKKALELVLEKYKAFKVRLKKGFFWYYFEENEKMPIICMENDYPFKRINTKRNNNYLFKVTYFKNKINIDFFHVLTDGNGGGEFFREIIYKYLELKYPSKLISTKQNKEEILQDSENAYKKNYKKCKGKDDSLKNAYMIKGEKLAKDEVRINHFNIDLKEIKSCAKSKECSLSIYLLTMFVYSIYETNYKINKGKKPINISVPINLKKYFQTETISNFFTCMVININLKKNQTYLFDDILEIVKKEFAKKLKIEKIVESISSRVGMTNNIFIRIVPLFLKKFFVRIGSLRVKRYLTTTFSNIGKFEVENKYSRYIENFLVIVSPDWAEKIKCGVCSYEGNLVMTFGTILKDNQIENKFKELLKENNINFEIKGNKV